MRQFKISNTITQRNTDSVRIYLNDIGRYSLISPEEEVELARQIKSDNKDISKRALDKLVSANLRFVVSVANQYIYTGNTLDDLISVGNIGLIKAAYKFDETKGFKFISYAVWWIRQCILSYIDHNTVVQMPDNGVQLIKKYYKLESKAYQDFQSIISDDEAAAKLQISRKDLVHLKKCAKKATSLDEKVDEDGNYSVSDYLLSEYQTDSGVVKQDLSEDISRSLELLSEIEKKVILESFGIGCDERSMYQIAEELDMTRERVRQIRTRALEKLRKEGKLLKKYTAA